MAQSLIFAGVFLTIFTGCQRTERTPAVTGGPRSGELARLMARPLIAGASISADHGTASPGKRLALRYTPPGEVRVIARGGAPGVEMEKSITESALADRTIVIAMDFFFWDSTHFDARWSLAALRSLVDKTAARGIPLLLGDIPEIIPGGHPTRKDLNEGVRAACLVHRGCRILEQDRIYQSLRRRGFVEANGRHYTLPELMPDGLHLSPAGAEFMADRMTETLSRPALQ